MRATSPLALHSMTQSEKLCEDLVSQESSPHTEPNRVRELEDQVAALEHRVHTLQLQPPPLSNKTCEYVWYQHLDRLTHDHFDHKEWVKIALKSPAAFQLNVFDYSASQSPSPADQQVKIEESETLSTCGQINEVKELKRFLYTCLLLTYGNPKRHAHILRESIESHQRWLWLHKMQSRLSTKHFSPLEYLYFSMTSEKRREKVAIDSITRAIIAPCLQLNISPRVALVMLRVFPYTIQLDAYTRLISHGPLSLFWESCPHIVAAKVRYDADYLVDNVAPSVKAAGTMKRGIRRFEDHYFLHLSSWLDFELSDAGTKRLKERGRGNKISSRDDLICRWRANKALSRLEKNITISEACHPHSCREKGNED